jgi:hypothetical protein
MTGTFLETSMTIEKAAKKFLSCFRRLSGSLVVQGQEGLTLARRRQRSHAGQNAYN